jgi:hypothetical protein
MAPAIYSPRLLLSVAFFTMGRAQKLTLRIYKRGRKRTTIPACKPIRSFSFPMSREKMAPPAMAVQRMPAKEPWYLGTLFSAREK